MAVDRPNSCCVHGVFDAENKYSKQHTGVCIRCVYMRVSMQV